MAVKVCANCNEKVDENAFICKFCGAVHRGTGEELAVTANEKHSRKGEISFIVALIVLVILAIVLMIKQ
ncbi:hypothetical protein [Paenibacillus cremeus]|uniref:Uncharacterized protein n=1 Tax=Paenibacillus cremeus TaxID=2163881 RepID=A0A559KFH9_9BACL|nr:hypothetical protein [Paenibacillus cremeus]TVY10881.1 hypothetical protein FPZ49_05190 [Paenibacillus cremeus]